MTPTTGCLILAVVVIAGLWKRDRKAILRELERVVGFINTNTHGPRVCASLAAKWYLDLAEDRAKRIKELRASADTTTKHNRDLQAKIAELESERRAYDLTVANCDHLRAENERLANQLEAVGIKSAEVMVAEHDRIGVTQPIAFEEIQLSHAQAAQLERIREKQHWQPVAAIGSVSVLNSAGEQVTQKIEKLRHNPPRVRDDETND